MEEDKKINTGTSDSDNAGDENDTKKIKIQNGMDRNMGPDDEDLGPEAKQQRPIVRLILLGLLVIIILGSLGGLGGYLTALNDRQQNEQRIVSTEVADQFLLGLIAFERGDYEIARQHFEYILKIDPGNMAAAEKLTETLLKLGESNALPTLVPTATLTPTPDTRSQEELFQAILSYKEQENWTAMIDTLNALRVKDPAYMAVEVDGMYYLAYRNRGMQRIQVEGNLEGGIFDLNRAELFGYLDAEADNYRTWASRYITGVSFWGVDWQEVINYFQPLAITAPFLSDSNFFTVQDRLATAQVEVNNALVQKARTRYAGGNWCEAFNLYNEADAYIQLTDSDREKFEDARNKCLGIGPTQESTPESTPESTSESTPEPTTGGEPTPTPSQTPEN
ncbi:MAG: hypothetical protein PVI99_03075 [Anaerolineales bacterium]|jgi:tetratricopeptide (TPR) repeat protein